jgi:hypothetical protein
MNASRIMRFTQKGKYLSDIGHGAGDEQGYFNKPRDIAMDAQGYIVVTDQKSNSHRIQVFTPEGKFLRSFAEKGTGPGQIDWPHGLAFDSHGHIYVTDVANQRINKYDSSGKFLLDFGDNSPNADQLKMPHGLTITPNDAVFVSDYFGTIQKFSSEGEYLLAFRNTVHTEGSAFIHTICSDHLGNVYLMVRGIKGFAGSYEDSAVEDRSFYIAKYDNEGHYLCTIALSDKKCEVIHATVDRQGNIYALFKGNGKMGVEVLGTK